MRSKLAPRFIAGCFRRVPLSRKRAIVQGTPEPTSLKACIPLLPARARALDGRLRAAIAYLLVEVITARTLTICCSWRQQRSKPLRGLQLKPTPMLPAAIPVGLRLRYESESLGLAKERTQV